jgi:hypothetical protein
MHCEKASAPADADRSEAAPVTGADQDEEGGEGEEAILAMRGPARLALHAVASKVMTTQANTINFIGCAFPGSPRRACDATTRQV